MKLMCVRGQFFPKFIAVLFSAVLFAACGARELVQPGTAFAFYGTEPAFEVSGIFFYRDSTFSSFSISCYSECRDTGVFGMRGDTILLTPIQPLTKVAASDIDLQFSSRQLQFCPYQEQKLFWKGRRIYFYRQDDAQEFDKEWFWKKR